jgi:hypothetical protein
MIASFHISNRLAVYLQICVGVQGGGSGPGPEACFAWVAWPNTSPATIARTYRSLTVIVRVLLTQIVAWGDFQPHFPGFDEALRFGALLGAAIRPDAVYRRLE